MVEPWLTILVLWVINGGLSWMGLVRHLYRLHRAYDEQSAIESGPVDDLLRFAISSDVTNECFRVMMKGALFILSMLTLWRVVERLEETRDLLDWRDVAAGLIVTVVLLLLTWWSNLELRRRPARG